MDDCATCGKPGKVTYRVDDPNRRVTFCWDCAPSLPNAIALGLLEFDE